jgi:hypothetical protein
VRVNPGSEPDRDDFGLPPVDIEIPDDARELDRDVQAYQRELRALRRRDRVSRLRGPLARDGMVLPLLAGCLILALVTSTLLIMFAADQTGMPELPRRATTAAATPTASQPAAGKTDGPLPPAEMIIGGKQVPLHTITAAKAAVLALVPQDCRCAAALEQFGAQAAQAHVALYLVGTATIMPEVFQLATQAGQPAAQVAEDPSDVLGRAYGGSGMTAVLVGSDGTVPLVVHDVVQPANLKLAEAGLPQLGSATPAVR